MCSIATQKNPTNSHLRRTSLVHVEESKCLDLVLLWLWVAGEYLSELVWESFSEFLLGKSSIVSISDAPQSILRNSHGDEPVVRMDCPLDVGPAVLVEVVINLIRARLAPLLLAGLNNFACTHL